MPTCKLCLNDDVLKNSHIVPRALFKHLKSNSPQLVNISLDDERKPFKSNADPKEPLFCGTCEQHFSKELESYCTGLLRATWNQRLNKKRVTIRDLDYRKAYFYFVSILWRASIASIPMFKKVTLGDELNEIIRECILNLRFSTKKILEY